MSTIQIGVADQHTTLSSPTSAVTDWVARYFRPWWTVESVDGRAEQAGICAAVDPARYAMLHDLVLDAGPTETTYAKARTLVASSTSDGATLAVAPAEGLAYRVDPSTGALLVVGRGAQDVSLAACRLVREVLRARLGGAGWTLMHASAAVVRGQAVLSLGAKGAGKTTAGLLLARQAGWGLLANDRVFVRAVDGELRVLPWPAAAALGLGLLDALGHFDDVQARLRGGEQLHPTQHPSVTAALLAGHREPLRESGRELKAQFWPDQLTGWLGLPLARDAEARLLLYPTIEPGAEPGPRPADRSPNDDDWMDGPTEDRYPDFLRLRTASSTVRAHARAAAAEFLADLPRVALTLGHNTEANADALTTVIVDVTVRTNGAVALPADQHDQLGAVSPQPGSPSNAPDRRAGQPCGATPDGAESGRC